MSAGRADGHVYRATLTLADPRRFRVQLVDREGRTNKLATEIVANVTRNRPPVVKMTQPAHDVRVSPLEELKLKAELEDDFGLVRHGLSYSMAGREPREIVLPAPAARQPAGARPSTCSTSNRSRPRPTSFSPTSSGPRTSARTASRGARPATCSSPRSGHFEEIFRQGEQPPSGSAENEEQEGQQGNAQASDQLAELQKEIINGTWKLIRRETPAKPSAKLAEDAKVLAESQALAIEQAGQLAERLQDAASKANLDQATAR